MCMFMTSCKYMFMIFLQFINPKKKAKKKSYKNSGTVSDSLSLVMMLIQQSFGW